MRIIDSEEQYLVDLKWPQVLPQKPTVPVASPVVAEPERDPNGGQTFYLTGWRGAGWRMVFPDEST